MLPGSWRAQAASVDEVSGGRLVLGIGAGWNEAEFRAFGFPFDRRVSRFEESFESVRRLLAGDRVSFSPVRSGSVEDAVLLPPPARRVPLMVGANGERMLSIALLTPTRGTRGTRRTGTRSTASQARTRR